MEPRDPDGCGRNAGGTSILLPDHEQCELHRGPAEPSIRSRYRQRSSSPVLPPTSEALPTLPPGPPGDSATADRSANARRGVRLRRSIQVRRRILVIRTNATPLHEWRFKVMNNYSPAMAHLTWSAPSSLPRYTRTCVVASWSSAGAVGMARRRARRRNQGARNDSRVR